VGNILVVLHVTVCVFLIAIVLLQRGKGAEIGAVFGGGASSTVFGSRGAGNLLTKLTTACAAMFMLTSLALAYVYNEGQGERLFEAGVPSDAIEEPLFEEVLPEDVAPAAPEATAPPETSDTLEVDEPVGSAEDTSDAAAESAAESDGATP